MAYTLKHQIEGHIVEGHIAPRCRRCGKTMIEIGRDQIIRCVVSSRDKLDALKPQPVDAQLKDRSQRLKHG